MIFHYYAIKEEGNKKWKIDGIVEVKKLASMEDYRKIKKVICEPYPDINWDELTICSLSLMPFNDFGFKNEA